MTTDYMNQMTENMKKFAEYAFTPASDIQKLNVETFEYYTRKNLEAMNEAFENASQKMQKLAGIKQFDELTQFCNECAREANETVLVKTREWVDDSISVSKKYMSALDNEFKAAEKQAQGNTKTARSSEKQSTSTASKAESKDKANT